MRKIDVDCCVVGGGPAGIMAGLLFARAGCRTVVLEKHSDFLRDFRGDTVHPSTLENLRELGLLESFLQRPHQKLAKLAGVFGGKRLDITDFSSLKTPNRHIVFMPQWHFLDFLCDAARELPTFSIEMKAEAEELVITNGRVTGARARTPEGPLEISARLTIGADGRNSIIRQRANLEVEELGVPIDVLWFMVPKTTHEPDEPLLNTGPGHIVITIDRGRLLPVCAGYSQRRRAIGFCRRPRSLPQIRCLDGTQTCRSDRSGQITGRGQTAHRQGRQAQEMVAARTC